MEIRYELNPPSLSTDDFIAILAATPLGARRPLTNPDRMARMLRHANLIVVAYAGAEPVGIARAWSDFAYACYLADLAVKETHQRRGIGRALIQRVREAAGPESMLLLLAGPEAATYYPHLGFEHVNRAWQLPRRS